MALAEGDVKKTRGRELRVARPSRALAKASRLRELFCAFATRNADVFTAIHIEESSFWRDAKTNARDGRATRIPRSSRLKI